MSEQNTPSLPVPKMKRGPKAFFAGVKRELHKVSWPTYKETNRLFGVVLSVCLILIVTMTTLGFAFDFIIGLLIGNGGAK
ncbi:MAG: preprotein translocase subunit SecE [Fimbriimonas sp.]|jgi:preprotein translocase SecE subunit|nr:preprotein translocase subunit SecE [Fimbriimonadales bacterium]